LAIAKFKYAGYRLELSRVRALSDGVVLFADKDEWIGRPVSTGEKIMRIADPRQMDFRIKLAVGDSIILEDGSSARIFLDADPLNPVEANIVRRSFHAKSDENNKLSYELIARSVVPPQSDSALTRRIGVRGTSQLFGAKVPLAFFLFRKPLSAVRQYLGL
ncbi:MAG: HlyD family secretion protein, partial [Rhizobiaceae bacterium]|nr:HlyD family secretion protein [Rhizobiaceae bacterium]